jgi:hypothetical protein
MFMDVMQFYHSQLRRYLVAPLVVLVVDFILLFVSPEFPGKQPLIAITSGSLGGFVRFLVAERIPAENLHDTSNMFRYWASLAVGAVLGFFSYLLLIDARLLKLVYPSVSIEPGSEPSSVSAAIFGGIAGLFAEQLVMAAQRRLKQDGS